MVNCGYSISCWRWSRSRDYSDPYEKTRAFYNTPEWKSCRNQYLDSRGEKRCDCCGRIPDPNYKPVKPNPNRPQWEKDKLKYEWQCNRILVDHKLPVKYYWGLRLTPSNFQLLCGLCNEEKMNEIVKSFLEKEDEKKKI